MARGSTPARRQCHHPLGDSEDVHREQGVVDGLHGVPRPDRPEVHHACGKRRDHTPRAADVGLGATAHHGELTRCGQRRSAAHWRIHECDADVSQQLSQPARGRRIAAGAVDHDRPWPQPLQQPFGAAEYRLDIG